MRVLASRAAAGTVAAVALALAVYVVARGTGESFVLSPMGQTTEVAARQVVFTTVAGGLMGLVVAVLAVRTSRPRRTLLLVGVLGTVLSFFNPASATDSAGTILWLCLMHVVVAVAVIGALTSVVPERSGEPGPSR